MTQEQRARAYCEDIGADPDETVLGKLRNEDWYRQLPRWNWYVGTLRDSYVSGVGPCNALHGDSTVSLGEAVNAVLDRAPISLARPRFVPRVVAPEPEPIAGRVGPT